MDGKKMCGKKMNGKELRGKKPRQAPHRPGERAKSDILFSTINPNAGSLNTVGALGVNTTDLTGFDILSNGVGGNIAYALLTASSGVASLYTVNLGTGAATSVGVISQTAASRPYSLAIVQPIPEPGTLLFGFALAGACLARTRRQVGVRH